MCNYKSLPQPQSTWLLLMGNKVAKYFKIRPHTIEVLNESLLPPPPKMNFSMNFYRGAWNVFWARRTFCCSLGWVCVWCIKACDLLRPFIISISIAWLDWEASVSIASAAQLFSGTSEMMILCLPTQVQNVQFAKDFFFICFMDRCYVR